MDWSKGYSASYYATLVDPATWRSTTRIEIKGGSISRSASMLMESADLETGTYPDGVEHWVRVYMDTRQANGASAHTALFTGLATSPKRSMDGIRATYDIECYSVLKPAADILLPRGWYALAGQNGGELIQSLLIGPAPVTIEGTAPALSESIVAEDGESNLSMASKILLAIDWRLRIAGDGSVTICPQASDPVIRFGETQNDCIETKLAVEHDLFPCPNVFRAVVGDISETAVDDSSNSLLSTVNRGREVWAEELSPTLGDNEGLAAYAQRRLRALQTVAKSIDYDRRFHPDVYVGDLVGLAYPRQGLEGVYQVISQKITLGYGAKTSEEVSMIVDALVETEMEVSGGYLVDAVGDYLVDDDGDYFEYVAVS